ncbi:MAG: LacI family transcriptional regulator [Lachnospiraceae bacterium]|nr:LacI family transcriptional regulator [Lachnospiraceae bacterium]
MITTQELAKLAGVSQSTVSRSLNNSPRISATTREKIQTLAKQHGYNNKKKMRFSAHPNNNNRNGGIAIVIGADHMRAPLELYLEYLTNEVIHQINHHQYYATILPFDASNESLQHIQATIDNGDIKGVVIIYHDYQTALEKYLTAIHIPHIYTQYFSRTMKKNLNIIDVDHFTGGALATNHLISLGHKRICTLTNSGSDFDERTDGYLSALKKHGLPIHPEWIIHTGNTYENGYNTITKHWDALQNCTAFFAQTDLVGIAVINFLKDQGFSVPAQYSVIGFDGISEGAYCRPELTTILQPTFAIAETSLKRLTYLIEHQDNGASHSFVPPQLFVRKSTAKAVE